MWSTFTLVAVAAALIAAGLVGIALHFISARRNGDEHRPESVPAPITRELQTLVERAQAAADQAKNIAGNVIAAVKLIEPALRDLSQRIAKLEGRDRADPVVSQLGSLVGELQQRSTETAMALDGLRRDFDALNPQHMSAQIADLGARIEQVQEDIERKILAAVESRLEGVEANSGALKAALHQSEERRGELSNQISVVTAIVSELRQQVEARSEVSETAGIESVSGRQPDEAAGTSAGGMQPLGPLEPPPHREPPSAIPGDLPPEKHGGRPREAEIHRDEASPEPPPPPPRIELMATRESGEWAIFAVLRAEDASNLRVIQGHEALPKLDEADLVSFGPLEDLNTIIQVFDADNLVSQKPLITDSSPLLFAMHGSYGRGIRRPARGLNFAVVPNDWKCDRETVARAPVQPEPLSVPGYTAHYFSNDSRHTISFERPNQESVQFQCGAVQFRLEGRCLPDIEDRMGPLFGGDPPILRGEPHAMERVRKIVVGREGPGRGRWRRSYECVLDANGEWPIPIEVAAQGVGWYFVRLYDSKQDLLDSLDFRYVPDLAGIDVATDALSLTDAGLGVCVEFLHDESLSVEIADERVLLGKPEISRSGHGTSFKWMHNPDVREATFHISDHNNTVRVKIDTDTLWWSIFRSDESTTKTWQSTPIELTAIDLAPTSSAVISLRFPRLSPIRAHIGFDWDDRRLLKINADGDAAIRLNSFSDAIPADRLFINKIRLWMFVNESDHEFYVASVNVPAKCQWCEAWFDNAGDLANHVLGGHADLCFERLNLKGERFNRAIFVCLGDDQCGQYYPESNLPWEKATDRLARHSNEAHRGKLSFKKIEDPQDIKNLLGLKDKWVWRCRLGKCQPITPAPGDENSSVEKRDHLLEEHLGDISSAERASENRS